MRIFTDEECVSNTYSGYQVLDGYWDQALEVWRRELEGRRLKSRIHIYIGCRELRVEGGGRKGKRTVRGNSDYGMKQDRAVISLLLSLSISPISSNPLNLSKAAFPASRAHRRKPSKTEISRDPLHPGAVRYRDNSAGYRYRISNTSVISDSSILHAEFRDILGRGKGSSIQNSYGEFYE